MGPKQLEDIGLSDKEARVYLAALELGRGTADQLSRQAGVNRSTTYVQLETLMDYGLMSTFVEGKKTFFAPESPELLKRLLVRQKDQVESRERELIDLLPELIRKFEGAGERPVVRFFLGKEGVTSIREDMLTAPRDSGIQAIYSLDLMESLYSNEELREYVKLRVKHGIKLHSIYTRKAGKLLPNDIAPLTERRFVPHARLPLEADFYTYGNKLAVIATGHNVSGIIVENKAIVAGMRAIFGLLWTVSEGD